MAEKEYRYIGSHADMLANGRPVEPGEYVDLTDEDLQENHNKMLLDDGKLLLIEEEDTSDQEIATEAAKAFAAENSVDLSQVEATGSSGLITKGDVEKHIAGEEG